MTQKTKRIFVRFLKVFASTFLGIFISLSKPIADALVADGFSIGNIAGQFWVIAQVSTVAGFIGALEKAVSWKDGGEV